MPWFKLILCALFISLAPLAHAANLILGAERSREYLPLLANKKVGLVVNQTSTVKQQHLLDVLLSEGVNVSVLFAPEHGVRGNKGAGEHIQSGEDTLTGIPIQSIYGKHKTPPSALMQSLDVIVFDIQDVGTRFYTYISSMHYMMEAASKYDVSFVVLDRPNPNGEFVDGPILEPAFQSFVGMHPIPILHGLTVGELALMIKGEKWIAHAENLDLHVVTMQNYRKNMPYALPIAPSPNLPNQQSVTLYPSLCFFEATALSIGRGTDFPFQVLGHNKVVLGDFAFKPISKPYAAPHPKLENTELLGIDLRQSATKGFDLRLFIEAYEAFENRQETFFTAPAFMDKLAGTDKLRLAIEAGKPLKEIKQSWQNDLKNYKLLRQAYLLYPLE